MSYRCLADFLEELGQAGELLRVEAEVDPLLEAAEITRRTVKLGGAALVFGSVKGHQIPLLTNLLGTEARICRALGTGSLDEAAERIAALVDPAEPEGWFEKLMTAPHVATLSSVAPRSVKRGACQRVVRLASDVNLRELPLLDADPQGAPAAITAATIFTADPESGRQVGGRHDMQLLGSDRLAACWADHDEPARLLGEYRRRRQRMPLAVVLGGDPAQLLAVAAELPPEVDACALAGLLREKPIDVVACRSVELQVPAQAEIVIEGHIDPSEPPVEAGNLCTPAGHCGLSRAVPAMQVTALTHRANPVYPAMVPGRPPHEACIVRRAMARVLMPLTRLAIPELVDYDLPLFGASRHWATLSIRKSHAGQARRVTHAAWGLRQLMFAKLLVVVDEEIDVRDQREVLRAIASNVNPGRDVFCQQGPPDPFDAATPAGTLGQKMAIDATAKLPAEHAGTWPEPAATGEQVRRLVSGRWAEYGLGPPDEGSC